MCGRQSEDRRDDKRGDYHEHQAPDDFCPTGPSERLRPIKRRSMSRSLRLGNEFLPFAAVETIGYRNQSFGGNKPMRMIKVMVAVFVVGTLWVGGALAQDTNAPLTKIEIFEARTGTVIVRGSVLIGTMSAQTGTVSVRAKEDVEPGLGSIFVCLLGQFNH